MSSQPLEQYKDPEYIKSQILIAHEAFGCRSTTRAQYDALEKCLSHMYFHCPEELMNSVYVAMLEAERRRVYFELNFWKDQEFINVEGM